MKSVRAVVMGWAVVEESAWEGGQKGDSEMELEFDQDRRLAEERRTEFGKFRSRGRSLSRRKAYRPRQIARTKRGAARAGRR